MNKKNDNNNDINEIVYKILKEIKKGKRPTGSDFGITTSTFNEIVTYEIIQPRLVDNANSVPGGNGNGITGVLIKDARVNANGESYLSYWSKTYE
ncbi:hypothetical protein COM86_12645 [Priestia megaterium]|uniref:hypothetical protein n=1 Tax=Priestia megaterium TaxID=1404 RepID=UPI000BED2540|nr:hypothetical protein [Priestia megaterium]MED3972267.1 hypothetical protein [Priestia megaterium]PEB63301.1 hypothetical protein COM86_12645 [Priestia megaterium]